MVVRMSGLPGLSYGEVLARPRPVTVDREAGSVWRDLGDAAHIAEAVAGEEAAKSAAAQGVEQADKAARGEINRDADGNPVVDRPLLRVQQDAFDHAFQLRYWADTEGSLLSQYSSLYAESRGDPEKFQAGIDGVVSGSLENAPGEFAVAIDAKARELGNQFLRQLSAEKMENEARMAKGSAQAALQRQENDILALAHQGAAGTETGQKIIADYANNLRAQVGNPLFGMSAKMADQKISELNSKVAVESLIGNLDRGTVGLNEVKNAIYDPELNLTGAERITLVNRAQAVQGDKDEARRAAEIEARRQQAVISDERLKDALDLQSAGKLTNGWVESHRDEMTASDYKMAKEMARGGGGKDDPNLVADLAVSLDEVPPRYSARAWRLRCVPGNSPLKRVARSFSRTRQRAATISRQAPTGRAATM
jgi:carbon monoxide dehydrogenase subunit G